MEVREVKGSYHSQRSFGKLRDNSLFFVNVGHLSLNFPFTSLSLPFHFPFTSLSLPSNFISSFL